MLILLLKAPRGNLVQTQDGLVRILDQDKLAFLFLAVETHVRNGTHDTPAVGQGQVHLVGEVAGFPANDAEDDVLVVEAGVDARDESEELR